MRKLLLFSALFGMIVATGTATVNQSRNLRGSSKSLSNELAPDQLMKKSISLHNTWKRNQKKSTRSDQNTTAVVKVDFDKTQYVANSVFVFDATGENGAYVPFEDATSVNIDIAPGKYDMVVGFSKIDESGNEIAKVYVTRTGIEINNSSEFEVSSAEATTRYSFSSVDHTGAPLELSTYRIVEDSESEWGFHTELIKEGNILNLTINSALFREGFGWTVGSSMMGTGKYEGQPDPLDCQVFYTNGEEGWFPYQMRGLQTGPDTNELIVLIPSPENAESTANSVDDFTKITPGKFQKTEYALSQPHQVEEVTFPSLNMRMGNLDMNAGSSPLSPSFSQTEAKDIFISVPAATSRTRDWRLTVSPKIGDLVVMFESDTTFFDDGSMMISTNIMYNNILGVPYDISSEKNLNGQGVLSTGFLTLDFLASMDATVPYHPYLPTPEEAEECVFGSTQPAACGLFAGNDDVYLEYFFTDIYGGNIGSYQDACDFQVRYNDNEIINSNESDELLWRFQNLVNPWFWEEHAPGKYQFDIQTFRGRIDGMKSQTTLSTGFDQTKSDCVAPSVQILNFVNKEGKITNTFNTPSEGTLRIVAGDYVLDPEAANGQGAYVNALDVVDPVVEYSPYGKGEWKGLETGEIDGLQAPACYAPAFNASLENIREEALMGWFDLRISMTDKAGNFMTQTISPAFKIESLAGVSDIDPDMDIKVAGNTIYAPEDASVFNMNGQSCRRSGLEPGIYIVRTGKKSTKVVIR